eukprot:546263-Rhodomonas_salina.3
MLETHDSSATQHMVAPETKGFLKLLCSGNRQCPPELFEKIWPAERTLVGLRVSKSLRQLLFTNVRRMSFVRSKDAEVNEKLLMKAFSHSKNFHRTAPLEVALEWRGQLCGLNCAVRCAVSGTNLTLLKVTPYNGLGAKGAEGLANALSECTSLTRLELGAGHIGDAGTEKLAMVVGNSKAMTHLDLEANCIGFKGAERLAKVLGGCTALVQLNLNENSLGAAGMPSLSTALADCKALAFLYLRGNLFGDAGAESLAKDWQCRSQQPGRSGGVMLGPDLFGFDLQRDRRAGRAVAGGGADQARASQLLEQPHRRCRIAASWGEAKVVLSLSTLSNRRLAPGKCTGTRRFAPAGKRTGMGVGVGRLAWVRRQHSAPGRRNAESLV